MAKGRVASICRRAAPILPWPIGRCGVVTLVQCQSLQRAGAAVEPGLAFRIALMIERTILGQGRYDTADFKANESRSLTVKAVLSCKSRRFPPKIGDFHQN